MTTTVLAPYQKQGSGPKYVFRRPSLSISKIEPLARNSQFCGPCQKSLRPPFIHKSDSSSGIVHLSFARRPFAIAWAVIFVYIASLYCHAFGAFTHVLKKVQEFMPARTYANASSAVVLKQSRALGVAASMHVLPCFECGSSCHPMRGGSLADLIGSIQASARFEVSTSESIGNAWQFLSATASTQPIGWASRFFAHYFSDGSQSTKHFSWLNWSPHMREFNTKHQAAAR
jgi:hypothetical protein